MALSLVYLFYLVRQTIASSVRHLHLTKPLRFCSCWALHNDNRKLTIIRSAIGLPIVKESSVGSARSQVGISLLRRIVT